MTIGGVLDEKINFSIAIGHMNGGDVLSIA
jgi:hypothetical protein